MTDNTIAKRLHRAEKGQSLVEMAVGMVILIMLASGLLDLGRIYYIYVALEDAVGEASLYLSLDPFCLEKDDTRPDGSKCLDPNNAMYRAENAVGHEVVDWSLLKADDDSDGKSDRIHVFVPQDLDGNPLIVVGEQVSVEIEYPIQLLTPIIPQFTGINPVILRTSAAQTIIREHRCNYGETSFSLGSCPS